MLSKREEQCNDFLKKNIMANFRIESIKSDASNRKYFRIFTEERTYILMDAPPKLENISQFIAVDKILYNCGLSVPEIYFEDQENGFLLCSDFGNETYKNVLDLSKEKNAHLDEQKMYERSMDALAHLHQNSNVAKDLLPVYSEKKFIDEAMIFIDWYVNVLNGSQISSDLMCKYKEILSHLYNQMNIYSSVVVLRDYHAENIFWLENEVGIKRVGIIDFQDAVIGSPVYDIVSILQDARRDVSEQIVTASITRYLKSFPNHLRKDFMTIYSILGLQRNLRIIGVFTKIAMKNRNSSYLSLLPRVWRHVHNNLKHPILFPMRNLLEQIVPSQMPNFYAQKTKSLEKVT